MSVCEAHLQECFNDALQGLGLPWPADPDAKRVYGCIDSLLKIGAWSNQQRNRYAADSHALFVRLRRDGLAFTALVLQQQAQAKAGDALPLADQPKFVLLAHLIACLGTDLSGIGVIERAALTGRDSTVEKKVNEVVHRLLDLQSLDSACFLNLRALDLSEWFKRYAESLLKVNRQAAHDQNDNPTGP